MNTEEEIEITKIDALQRQLSEAVLLFFEGRDPVAVHTLTSAACQIATDIARSKGLRAPLRDIEFLEGRRKQAWVRALKSTENFFKHADKDPEATFSFHPVITPLFMAEAIAVLWQLGVECTVEIEVYQIWFLQKYGKYYSHIRETEVFQHFDIKGTNLDDLHFFRMIIDKLRAERN
jgi:hypothetical protein